LSERSSEKGLLPCPYTDDLARSISASISHCWPIDPPPFFSPSRSRGPLHPPSIESEAPHAIRRERSAWKTALKAKALGIQGLLYEGTISSQGNATSILNILERLKLEVGARFAHTLELELESAWWSQMSAHLARRATLSAVWPERAPPPLLIKGADYEIDLYSSPGARGASDWDLLLPDPFYSEMVNEWTRRYGPPSLPRTPRDPHEAPFSVGFYIDQLLFELHRDPAPPALCLLSGATLWARGRPIELEGLRVLRPLATDRLWIWLAQYIKGGGAISLLGWVDFSLILARIYSETTLNQALLRGERRALFDALFIEAKGLHLDLALDVALHQWRRTSLCPEPLRAHTSPLSDQPVGRARLISQLTRLLPHPLSAQVDLPMSVRKSVQWALCPTPLRADYTRRLLSRALTHLAPPHPLSQGDRS
jgi:hypothetical protein